MGKHTLGDLQHAIMKVLWTSGEATSAKVHSLLLADRGLAPTTIATMLRKMEDKGVVAHRSSGRQFVYRPTVTESEVRRSMVNEIVERLFAGDPAELVSHLIEAKSLEPDELTRLKSMLDAAGREGDDHERP